MDEKPGIREGDERVAGGVFKLCLASPQAFTAVPKFIQSGAPISHKENDAPAPTVCYVGPERICRMMAADG